MGCARACVAQDLLRQHAPYLREHHFDEPVVRMLLRLPNDSAAMAVLDELGRNDLAMVSALRCAAWGCAAWGELHHAVAPCACKPSASAWVGNTQPDLAQAC